MEDIQKKVAELQKDLEKMRTALNKLLDSGMREKTVLVLMNHYTGIPQRKIKQVMDGLHDLEFEYFGEE